MKKPYLVVYDYRIAGLWAVIHARSEAEISAKYPELEILHDRPKWMTDERYNRIAEVHSYDIDEEPRHGWLSFPEASR